MSDTLWGIPVVMVDSKDELPAEPVVFGDLGDRYIQLREGEQYTLPDGTVAVGPGVVYLKLRADMENAI